MGCSGGAGGSGRGSQGTRARQGLGPGAAGSPRAVRRGRGRPGGKPKPPEVQPRSSVVRVRGVQASLGRRLPRAPGPEACGPGVCVAEGLGLRLRWPLPASPSLPDPPRPPAPSPRSELQRPTLRGFPGAGGTRGLDSDTRSPSCFWSLQ